MQGVGVVLLICLSIAAVPGKACSPPMFWNPQSFQERLQQASVVFRGKVISTSNDPTGSSSIVLYSPLYEATFEVECHYKGGLDTRLVTVAYFGFDGGMCTGSDVQKGKDYVIFADAYPGSGLFVANINIQAGATEVTQNVIDEVQEIYPCTAPTSAA